MRHGPTLNAQKARVLLRCTVITFTFNFVERGTSLRGGGLWAESPHTAESGEAGAGRRDPRGPDADGDDFRFNSLICSLSPLSTASTGPLVTSRLQVPARTAGARQRSAHGHVTYAYTRTRHKARVGASAFPFMQLHLQPSAWWYMYRGSSPATRPGSAASAAGVM